MMTLMEESGPDSSRKLFHNQKHANDEIEQFSLRLSTALRRNRNLDSASNILFTKVNRKPIRTENNNGFVGEIFAVTSSTEIRLRDSIEESGASAQGADRQTKDSWSLNACLSEISSINYGKFSTTEAAISVKQETKFSFDNGASALPPPFIQKPNHSAGYPRSSSIYSSEDELIFDENESVGSDASSISWAPDAVEAKLTQQLARLWEDIELVCSGQLAEKPKGMSHLVYEECQLWRRAFPEKSEHPSRFSTMTLVPEDENDSDSTATPTNSTRMFEFDSPPVSAKCRPSSLRKCPDTDDYYDFESRADNCATPNPANSSEYVSAWLTTHDHTFGQHQNKGAKESQITSPSLTTTHFRNMLQGNIIAASRPLSSNSVGHLLTPIPTGQYPVQRPNNGSGAGAKATNGFSSGYLETRKTDLPENVPAQKPQQIGSSKVNVPKSMPTAQMNRPTPRPLQLQGTGSFRNSGITRPSAFPTTQRSSIRRPAKEGAQKETPFLQWLLENEK